MRRLVPVALLALLPAPCRAAWPGTINLAAAQRGYAVYAQVCSGCHSMRAVAFADLEGLGLSPAAVRALAASRKVSDGIGDNGRPNRRPGRPDDHLPSPFATAAQAARANNGAVPPDMSRLALTLPGGAPAIAAILTGYRDAPAGVALPSGDYYDAAAPGGVIAMPPPLQDGAVSFADGGTEPVPRMASDVAAFLDWAAHPHRLERTRIGVGVVLYLLLLAVLALVLKRRIWRDVHHPPTP